MANQDPRELGEAGKSNNPAEAAATTARVRATRRAPNNCDGEPPANQRTTPPAWEWAATAATAEKAPAPSPSGPKTANTSTRASGRQDKAKTSAPTQQPSTKDRPAATKGDSAPAMTDPAPGGSRREPATATTPAGNTKAATPTPPTRPRPRAPRPTKRNARKRGPEPPTPRKAGAP